MHIHIYFRDVKKKIHVPSIKQKGGRLESRVTVTSETMDCKIEKPQNSSIH